MSVAAIDATLDALEELHAATLQAARAYVAGDQAAALVVLEDAQLTLDDVVADLRRAAEDPEP